MIGLGCGAWGNIGYYQYVNTYFLSEYIKSSLNGELPIAGARSIDLVKRSIKYSTCGIFVYRSLDKSEFKQKFGKEFHELVGKTRFGKMLKFFKAIRLPKERCKSMGLTRKGLFTAHKLTWAFVLNVPCRAKEEFRKTPWSPSVTIP